MELQTLTYDVAARIARITLDRPARGNGITPLLVRELETCVERADLDPAVHVILLSGNGKGFCGGYDLVESAQEQGVPGRGAPGHRAAVGDAGEPDAAGKSTAGSAPASRTGAAPGAAPAAGEDATAIAGFAPPGSPLDPAVMAANHVPGAAWDPMVDYAMMRRNVRAFMSLFHCATPVVCKVHGFCVAGGTDMALCSDLLVIAADAKIGYPPARVWGSPTTAMWTHRLGPQRAKRLLFTGDSLSGAEALQWGLAIDAPPADELDARVETLLERIARMPLNQLAMMKLLVNQELIAGPLPATQVLGTVLDGLARHTAEGYAFQQRAAQAGFREAVRERDEPFGDRGSSTFKG